MITMIPLKDGHPLQPEVIQGISNQTVPLELLCISRPKKSSDDPYLVKKDNGVISITVCRNILRETVLKSNEEFFLMLNSDVIFSSPTDVEDMLNFLKENEEFGLVALHTRTDFQLPMLEFKFHIDIACSIIRRYVLENIVFHNDDGFRTGVCNCKCLSMDMRKLQKHNRSTYLDFRQLREAKRI